MDSPLIGIQLAKRFSALCAINLVLAANSASAHHSFAAEFDASVPVTLKGAVTKIEWTNPHVHIWVDAADERGRVTNWMVESVAPNYLAHLGWTRNSLKVGDAVVIRAFAAKGVKGVAKTDTITLPDGRSVTTGRALDAATGAKPN